MNTSLNLDMEKITSEKGLPDGWFVWGSNYLVTTDTDISHQGNYSIVVSSTDKSANSFGCPAYMIPAKYEGKEIELKTYVKLENVTNGHMGLLMRIDGVSGSLAFDNMEDRGIKGTVDWTEYSIKLPYPKGAKSIYIGAMLTGDGKIWIDDFEVLIDGKNIKFIEPVEKVYKADQDKEFDNGSNIEAINLTTETTDYLKRLGLVWGFVKYYHPVIAKGESNWDYELFRRLPELLNATNNKERDKIIYKWIESLGEFEFAEENSVPARNVKLSPDLNWLDTTDFDKDLKELLLKIKNSKKGNEHYYIEMDPNVGKPIFSNERPYTEMKYPDAGFRLLSLYRYWNMIQYFFPYKHLIEEDWKDVLSEFIPKYVNASNELEYKLASLELIGRIHDTHANIWGRDDALLEYWGKNDAPYKVEFVEDQVIVTNFYDEEKAKNSGLQKGDIITHVNGESIKEIVDDWKKYTPASNYPTQQRDIARKLLKTNDSTIDIKYQRAGKNGDTTIKAFPHREINVHQSFAPDSCFRMINEDIAYLYPGKMKNNYLPEIMNAAANSKGLIIDFRCYPSDFFVFSLGSKIVDKNSSFVKFTGGRVDNPGYFVMGEPLEIQADIENHYKGKVVVLINETTQSSAEYHTMAFQAGSRTTVIGSTTAGADGNVSPIVLPGNIHTMISGIGVYYPDGRETQRIGIVPDIELKPTIKGIREGKDELLEKAIEIISQNE